MDEPSPLPLRRQSLVGRVWTSLKDPVGWRIMLYDVIRLPWGILTFTITLTSLFVLWPVLPYIARGLTNADRAMVRGLLSPSDELERRIAELESDRGVVVDTAAADLRRIERDLHDGAQARLVNLAMGNPGVPALRWSGCWDAGVCRTGVTEGVPRNRGGQSASRHRRGLGAPQGGPDPAADRPRT